MISHRSVLLHFARRVAVSACEWCNGLRAEGLS